ncbi:MAG TPA: bifunctional DNA primase/polymerase [Candidatus Corynebacterium gallistercoris]|uniref:Bifunctional DNA primase/polymerase n=1 Tax=Candidatus Corynebacterium gallistercoris TaxID=2838530 RepID=A0A9D1RVF5_9CORY|nr:bifunctional DNA primase/polymerase [Candidatus Corynebacterium gallistercoris]
MVDKALRLAAHGLEVGHLDGKRPLTRHGFKDFTTNPMQIRRWWSQHPTANIGARPPKWTVVLDIDPRNGGLETWQHLTGKSTHPTDTLVTLTGSGGWHIWYRLPYAAPIRGHAGDGIDVKARNGYLVMPGSIHPDTGRAYECVNWCALADLPELPTQLRKHVYTAPPKPAPVIPRNLQRKTTGAHLVRWLADAQDGSRNLMLFWAACRAVEHGYDILPDLAATAEAIGLPADEVARTITSAKRQTEKKAG